MTQLRVYFDPSEIGPDGYPSVWHKGDPAVKDMVREQAGNRCERCGHPYIKGNSANSPRSEWSPCDECCTHGGPIRRENFENDFGTPEAQWRILTVHHLNGIKHDLRWWNLVALCQRCHLTIQGKVHMQREWRRQHSEWFKPYAAGFYAAEYLGEDLSREETVARLDELLDLQLTEHPLPGLD